MAKKKAATGKTAAPKTAAQKTAAKKPAAKKAAAKKPAAKKTVAKKKDRDLEISYNAKQTVAKLRRLADCLEQGKRFTIQISGERVAVPADAVFSVEHEREGKNEEVEFQFKWTK